jgi:hypothetical protein
MKNSFECNQGPREIAGLTFFLMAERHESIFRFYSFIEYALDSCLPAAPIMKQGAARVTHFDP